MFKPGQIGFVMHHDNLISKVIAWFMGSKWSHSFLVIGEFHGRTLICETSDFHVTISDLDKYLLDRRCSVEVRGHGDLDKDSLRAMYSVVHEMNGEMYGYLQLASLGIRRVLKRINIRIPNLVKWGLVCCAVPIYALEVTPLNLGVSAESIDTEELYQATQAWDLIYLKVTK